MEQFLTVRDRDVTDADALVGASPVQTGEVIHAVDQGSMDWSLLATFEGPAKAIAARQAIIRA